MEYKPSKPHGRPVDSDPFFTLMAGDDGLGLVHCGDGVVVVPLTGDGQVLLAVERSPAFDREVLGLVGGEAEEGEPLERFVDLVESGELHDATAVAALFLAQRFLLEEK